MLDMKAWRAFRRQGAPETPEAAGWGRAAASNSETAHGLPSAEGPPGRGPGAANPRHNALIARHARGIWPQKMSTFVNISTQTQQEQTYNITIPAGIIVMSGTKENRRRLVEPRRTCSVKFWKYMAKFCTEFREPCSVVTLRSLLPRLCRLMTTSTCHPKASALGSALFGCWPLEAWVLG